MNPEPEIGLYQSRLGSEQFIRFCSNYNTQILLIEGFFEERNFLRHTVIGLGRALAARGLGCFIPDLPGSGESPIVLDNVTFQDWRDAVADSARWLAETSGCLPHIAAIRSGALLDDAATGASWWRFAPVDGSDLLRQGLDLRPECFYVDSVGRHGG